MKKAVVCEKEERKRQRKAALCNLRAKKRWEFWEKRLWILFWLAILRNARTASSTTLWGCTVAGCTDYDVSDGFSDSNTDLENITIQGGTNSLLQTLSPVIL